MHNILRFSPYKYGEIRSNIAHWTFKFVHLAYRDGQSCKSIPSRPVSLPVGLHSGSKFRLCCDCSAPPKGFPRSNVPALASSRHCHASVPVRFGMGQTYSPKFSMLSSGGHRGEIMNESR